MGMATNIQRPSWQTDGLPPFRIWYVLLLLPVVGMLAFALFQPIQVLPRISLAPGFAFSDQDGNRLTSDDLRGRLVFYNFTYTNCTAPCPQTSPHMEQIQQAMAEIDTGGLPIEYVTISFDPERDTPEVLRAYADSLNADTSVWHFVTGNPALLKSVIGAGFRTYYDRREDGSFTFDPVYALVDGWGILRATYRSPAPSLSILQRDIRLILEEIENQEGVTRYAYEAAHLFLCYP